MEKPTESFYNERASKPMTPQPDASPAYREVASAVPETPVQAAQARPAAALREEMPVAVQETVVVSEPAQAVSAPAPAPQPVYEPVSMPTSAPVPEPAPVPQPEPVPAPVAEPVMATPLMPENFGAMEAVRSAHEVHSTVSAADIAPSVADLDIAALSNAATAVPGVDFSERGAKLSRKERKAAKKLMKQERNAANRAAASRKKEYQSVAKQLKERDKELTKKYKDKRMERRAAKNILDYIGYDRMYQNGLCEVEEGLFSTSLSFEDTSYHSVRDDMQKGMFAAMTRLYDQFGADTLIQMNIVNTPLLAEEVGARKFFNPSIQDCAEAANDAAVFNEILNDKLREGVSNIKRDRFVTFSMEAADAEEAARKCARVENQATAVFQSMGSQTHKLDGTARLAVLYSQLNPMRPFDFSYERDIGSAQAQTTKDYIAPLSLDWKPEGFTDAFRTGRMWGQVLVMKHFGSELSDRALADIVDLPIPLNVSFFVQPMDKSKAIAFVRERAAWIDKEIIEEQRSAVNKGYDFSILPAELKYSKDETEDVLDNLQNKNQRLYTFTGLVYTYADSKEKLDAQVLSIISAARQNSIEVDVYDYRQREGLNSILPLGQNHVEISRMFTSAQVSILMPFATQELDQPGGNYVGQNKHSRNLVFPNRKLLASPMGFVCGKTGSGKGMFVKTEMTSTIFSNPTDEIFVIDRAGEYTGIAERYNGSVFTFGVDSNTYLNPFDTTSVEHMSVEGQIAFKTDAMLAQAGASAAEAGKNLSEVDQSIISRCVELAFERAEIGANGFAKPPLLEDFYNILLEQPEEQAKIIALRYERFVKGSMSFFNKETNIDFKRRIVDFNLKDLPDSMLVFGLINVCEAVRNRMYYNNSRGVRTWLYIEEMQSMFAYPTVLSYFSRFANEGRKFGLLLTGITQNATAMLDNKAAQNIVLNSDFLMLLKQSPLDRKQWSNLMNLSEQEEECIDESVEPGDGLLLCGAARVPIRGNFPKGNVLYELFSTNPNEQAERQAHEMRSRRERV